MNNKLVLKAVSIIDFFVPRLCVFCGTPIKKMRWPVCKACADSVYSELIDTESRLCNICHKPLISEQELCMRCRRSKFSFDAVTPLFRYRNKAKELILHYKSKQRRSLAFFFAELIAKHMQEKYSDWTIVPVPPRPGKLRHKGWDQIYDIVRVLKNKHGYKPSYILKRKKSLEQKTLTRDERAKNISNVFFLPKPDIDLDKILLIDDVMTTGATLSDCALALKKAGAKTVEAIVVAID